MTAAGFAALNSDLPEDEDELREYLSDLRAARLAVAAGVAITTAAVAITTAVAVAVAAITTAAAAVTAIITAAAVD